MVGKILGARTLPLSFSPGVIMNKLLGFLCEMPRLLNEDHNNSIYSTELL